MHIDYYTITDFDNTISFRGCYISSLLHFKSIVYHYDCPPPKRLTEASSQEKNKEKLTWDKIYCSTTNHATTIADIFLLLLLLMMMMMMTMMTFRVMTADRDCLPTQRDCNRRWLRQNISFRLSAERTTIIIIIFVITEALRWPPSDWWRRISAPPGGRNWTQLSKVLQ